MKNAKVGKATEENGAILRNINHQWFNRLSKERQAEINQLFQEYKRRFNLGIATITTEGITQVQVIELPEIEEDCIEIPVYDFTEKEYLEHKQRRNERVARKFEVER